MGFLSRLLGRQEARPDGEANPPEAVCPHATLIPRWDSADDMGKPERVVSYTCESCRESFTGEEGRRLLQHLAERLPIGEESRV